MKVQEVMLRALSGQLKWFQAAEILGSPRGFAPKWASTPAHRHVGDGKLVGCDRSGSSASEGRRFGGGQS